MQSRFALPIIAIVVSLAASVPGAQANSHFIPELTKPTKLWAPGQAISVVIDFPGERDDATNRALFDAVKQEFDRWTAFQQKRFGAKGLKFVLVIAEPKRPTAQQLAGADLIVRFVGAAKDNNNKDALGVTRMVGNKGAKIPPKKGGGNAVDTYTNTKGEIQLSKELLKTKDANGNTVFDLDFVRQVVQHEIGHLEGLPHTKTGVMREGGADSRKNEPKAPADLVSDGDRAVEAGKSAILVPLPDPKNPKNPAKNRVLNVGHGLNAVKRFDDHFQYDFDFSVDPDSGLSFIQVGLFLSEAPLSVELPDGWDFIFELFTETEDFLINGLPAVQAMGGWLTFFGDDPSITLDFGQTLPFSFTSGLPPMALRIGEYYGVTHDGDAAFLVFEIPESWPLSLVVMAVFVSTMLRRRTVGTVPSEP